jgi:hypothetical protein
MAYSPERDTFLAFGGYEEGGNKLFILNNTSSLGSENWSEEWQTRKI